MKHASSILILGACAFLSLTTGCREYNAPKFENVDNNETAYVIPLSGDTSAQAKFQSIEFLEQHKVAAKRIQIPRSWVDDGYLWTSGYYQDQIRVIKVDRTPITVHYQPDAGDAAAIWMESKDGIDFSTGFSVTALVKEEDTSTFLYRYKAMSLKQVLATEGHTRIQQNAASFSNHYILDDLRGRKNDVLAAIRADVIPFFAERGITITTIGQSNGMQYKDSRIQAAINNTFVSQQQKVNAAALLSAQHDVNEKAEQENQQRKRNAILVAEGEAQAITLVADAAKTAAANPAFIRLRELEIEGKRIEKWNGVTPGTLIEGTNGGGLNLFVTPRQGAQ